MEGSLIMSTTTGNIALLVGAEQHQLGNADDRARSVESCACCDCPDRIYGAKEVKWTDGNCLRDIGTWGSEGCS